VQLKFPKQIKIIQSVRRVDIWELFLL